MISFFYERWRGSRERGLSRVALHRLRTLELLTGVKADYCMARVGDHVVGLRHVH